MALTDISARKAKSRDKECKRADVRGLYLLVTPSSGRLWRLKCRLNGKEKKLALGRYPDTSISEARKLRDAAGEALSSGNDPAAAKRCEKIAAKFAMGVTFSAEQIAALEAMLNAAKGGRA